MKKRKVETIENQPANPFLATSPQRSINDKPKNPFSTLFNHSPKFFSPEKSNQSEFSKALEDFMPIIAEWNYYLSEVITERYTSIQRQDGFDSIEDAVLEYEKKYPQISNQLAQIRHNRTTLEEEIFITMQHIRCYEPLKPLNFDENFLKEVSLNLFHFHDMVNDKMKELHKQEKALGVYMNSSSKNPSIENINIIFNSIKNLELFLESKLKALQSEENILINNLQKVNKHMPNDPIAKFIHTFLTEHLKFLGTKLVCVTQFYKLCTSKKQELNSNLEAVLATKSSANDPYESTITNSGR